MDLKISTLNIEENTIRKACDNNRIAQKMIYYKYASKILIITKRYVKNQHDAEDVMIHAFFKVFKNTSSYNFEGSFEGGMRRIFVNESLNHLRKNNRLLFRDNDVYFEYIPFY